MWAWWPDGYKAKVADVRIQQWKKADVHVGSGPLWRREHVGQAQGPAGSREPRVKTFGDEEDPEIAHLATALTICIAETCVRRGM